MTTASASPLNPATPDDVAALLDSQGRCLSHGEVRQTVARLANAWPVGPGGLTLLIVPNTLAAVLAYLAAMTAGGAVWPLPPGLPRARVDALVQAYAPDVIVTDDAPMAETLSPDYQQAAPPLSLSPLTVLARRHPAPAVHPDLAVCLSTSGSTGHPKVVRLSRSALAANTDAIIKALGITPQERAVLHLPLAYSFGLSVLHSHLWAGGSLLVTGDGFLDPAFWSDIRAAEATTLPGVPYHYEMLRRLGLDKLDVPSLTTFTQAGGRLDPPFVKHFASMATQRGGRLYVMYGQTEAGPRISVLPADLAATQSNSVGRAVPGTTLRIAAPDGSPVPAGTEGAVIVEGPGVMMGYATTRADLARGDDLGGRLSTGDLGYLDETGLLTLTGRETRFAKLFGLRLDLEQIERAMPAPTVAVEAGKHLILVTEGPTAPVQDIALELTGLHPSAVRVRHVDALPRTPSGKLDLSAIEAPT